MSAGDESQVLIEGSPWEAPRGGSRMGDQASASFVVCRCGSLRFALPVASVIETMRPLPVVKLKDMPEFVLGVATIRGRPTPVVDAGALLGRPGEAQPRRFVTVELGVRTVALAVDAVADVRAIDARVLERLPRLLGDPDASLTRVGIVDAELVVVLQTARLVPDDLWTMLEEQEAT